MMGIVHPPRVLVIDDSAASRALLAEVLEDAGCVVVGRAMDGAMALRLVADLKPDAITCDLEMPGMDGFTFLRLLAKNFPTPVIMVTSNARPEAALQSLELGARDFVVKPSRQAAGMRVIGAEVAARIFALLQSSVDLHADLDDCPSDPVHDCSTTLVALGASTGGPRAVREILGAVTASNHPPIVIAQHMPEGFTQAFADRLAKATGHDVAEARDDEWLRPGAIRIAPGGAHLEVSAEGRGFRTRIFPAAGDERHVPSVDRLLESAAAAGREHTLGIVLTGMGRDGAVGAKALALVGAPLWCESAATATINGMPQAAAGAHPNAKRLRLHQIGNNLNAMFAGLDAKK